MDWRFWGVQRTDGFKIYFVWIYDEFVLFMDPSLSLVAQQSSTYKVKSVWQRLHPLHHLHNGIITWAHFLHYWPFVLGIHRYSPHKTPVMQCFCVSLLLLWININPAMYK